MNEFPWLTILVAVPLVGAAVVAALPPGPRPRSPSRWRWSSRWSPLALTIAMALQFDADSKTVPVRRAHEWIPAFGVHYAVGVDGIALVLIALATVLTPICVLASWHDAEQSEVGDRKRSVKGLLRADAAARGDDDRRLRGDRRLPVLRVLRGDAHPDVLPDRVLRRRAALVRRGEVPALQPGRRAAHAGRGDRAVRRRPTVGRRPSCSRTCSAPRSAPAPSAGCSSASSSPSRSRRRCGRCTPGCRTPRPSRRPAVRCCWSACWTRSARSA